MRRIFGEICMWIRIQIRLIHLSFLRVEVPEDALTQEEMLAEIKKKINRKKSDKK